MKKHILFIVSLFIALTLDASVSNMIVERYTVKQGLPNNAVSCTLKDRDGFVWFGTWYGLCRFDGQKFYTYNKQQSPEEELPPRKIQHIVEDHNGNLWVKTIDHKLYVFNKRTGKFHSVYDDMKKYSDNIQVVKMHTNAEGDVLLLTLDRNLLLAQMDKGEKVNIKVLYDSQKKYKDNTYRLTQNVLQETEDYVCWIGVDDRITAVRKKGMWDASLENSITDKLQLSGNGFYTCIYEEGERLWLGDNTGMFLCVDSQTGAVDRFVLPELKGAIQNILVVDECVYVSLSGKGTFVYRLDNRQLNKINLPFVGNEMVESVVDKCGMIWFHEKDRALVAFDPQTGKSSRYAYQKGTKVGYGTLYVEDMEEHGLFFLTPFGEALHYDRKEARMRPIRTYRQMGANESTGHSFFHLYKDREGILWLASSDKGIYRINFPQQQFELTNKPAIDCTEKGVVYGVRALFQSSNGDIWVSTRKPELYRYDKNGNLRFIYGTGHDKIGTVYHIMEDRNGNLWLSTKGDGLVKAIPDAQAPKGFRFVRYNHEPSDPYSLSGKNVYYTYQDSKGRIWVGLFDGGLNLLDEKEGKTVFYHRNNSFNNYPAYGLFAEVRNIQEDNDGRIWVGTTDGLMSFNADFSSPDNIEFVTYRTENKVGLSASDVYALYKDKEQQIWACFFGGGVHKIVHADDENRILTFESYGTDEGLGDDVIVSMMEDNDSCLWLVSENGIASLDKKTGRIRNFDEYDGFPDVSVEEGVIQKTLEGNLWIGCRQGVLVLNPQMLASNKVDYDTFIVDCQINNINYRQIQDTVISQKTITYSDGLVLDYDQSMFTLEFAALNYTNPKRVSYRYILEGYENEWHDNGKNRIAAYTNVPSGEYVFKVQALDESNPTLESVRELKIKVLPPWWATRTAYIVYVLLFMALMALIIRMALLMMRMKNDVYIGQRISELKIKFFTNISHELRTPLTLIQGPIQELKENEELSGKGKQYVALMEKSIVQMLQLVNQILDFRKIQNGKMRLHISRFNLNEMLQGFGSEFRILAQENNISFHVEETDVQIKVWADADKLSIVIRNLLSNAFKFTPNGGSIYVKATVSPDGSRCYIHVKDTGVGIPKSQLSEIFERFSQAENVKAAAYYQGTGIGLALSKEIMNLHHGEIYAESQESKGACFVVELLMGKEHYKESEVDFYVSEDTLSEDEVSEGIYDDETVINSSLPSVLIVDDNKDLCNMLRLQLEDNYNIYMANDGVEGLKKVSLYHPDVVVTDQMMPNMDGMEMLQHIRKDFQISHIPVIILTAKGNDDARTAAISKGASAYITKPFSKDYLMARIEQLLNERKLFREHIWQTEKQPEMSKDEYGQYLETKDVQFIEKIHRIVEENLENSDFNIDTIAVKLGLSRSTFFKKLKGLTGFAPVDLVKEIRLNKAIELMKTTDMGISEIALAVGFRDAGYFGKCFRKKYNQTPREYVSECRTQVACK